MATSYTLADIIDIMHGLRGNRPSPKERTPSREERQLANYLNHLESRKVLATQLVSALLYLHAADLLHKSLTSANVVLCLDETATKVVPLLIGFHQTRRITDISDLAGDNNWGAMLYRHPSRWRISDNLPFIQSYDVYSLGVILLELGLCENISSLGPKSPSTDGREVESQDIIGRLSADVLGKFLEAEKRLERKQGRTFSRVVKNCLTLGREDSPEAGGVLDDMLQSLYAIKY
jgi:serine/threonine protein kinase